MWPLLLGVEAAPHDPTAYAALHSGGHKDSHVVDCDMARSLWSFTQGGAGGLLPSQRRQEEAVARAHSAPSSTHVWKFMCPCVCTPPCPRSSDDKGRASPPPPSAGWSEEAREERRGALRRVLNAAVGGNAAGVHYYQGLHDVAAVLLFTCDEAAAYRLLAHLAGCHLRDCTRPTLDAAVEMLSLLYPILKQVRGGGVECGW